MRHTRDLVIAVVMSTLFTGATAALASGEGTVDSEAAVEAEVDAGAGARVANTARWAVRCGDTITRHTRLTHDLLCPGTDTPVLRVVGEGIILDLGGHTVRRIGPETEDSIGILLQANSTVRNGTIQGFSRGVLVDTPTSKVWLHRLSLLDNGVAVYHVSSYARLLITSSRLSGNATGLSSEFDAATGIFDVRSTLFTHNQRAMFVDSHDVSVHDSTFDSNGLVVYCFNGRVGFWSSEIVQNTVVGTMPWSYGFDVCGEMRLESSLIANNTSFAPSDHPAWEPIKFVMRNSWVVNNGSGLRASGETVNIQGNTWWDNAGGLTLADLPQVVPVALTGPVRDNRFLRNEGDGLRVLPPSTPKVSDNIALGNTGWGIHAPTAIDGGGNVARDNGAGDCEGVVCAPY